MKNETKLNKVKEFLDGNNIKYVTPKNAGKKGHSDLFLPSFRIYIKLQSEDDELFYKTHHIGVHPIFIRDGETPKFVLEKVQNTIIKIMQKNRTVILHSAVLLWFFGCSFSAATASPPAPAAPPE